MNSIQVAAYLRIACSVLNFDIGELWIARKFPDQRPTLKFIQLYTSPNYEDFHSLLIRPETQQENLCEDDKHRISPIICRGVCDGGQIVWASTLISEGLIGRKELPLNTAVGMPICSIGQDLCIMVLFAVESIAITPNAIEFLGYLSRAASENIVGFIPPSLSTPVSPANAEQFVGIWDIFELIKKYSSDISFHILPIGPLQSFYDYQESMAFRDIFPEGQIQETLLHMNHIREYESSNEFKQVSDTNSYADFSAPMNNIISGGTFSLAFSDMDYAFTDSFNVEDSNEYLKVGNRSLDLVNSINSIYSVDARDSYRKHPYRFHELMIALLGMTIFDAAELWMISAKTGKLHVVAALNRDGIMEVWTTQGRTTSLNRGQDVPGRVSESSQPFWDNTYDKNVANSANYPRAEIAAQIGIKTALGIPLPGKKGSCGSLTLYSRTKIEVEPLMATFVTRASQLISASATLGPTTMSLIDVESLVYNPSEFSDQTQNRIIPFTWNDYDSNFALIPTTDLQRSSSFSMKVQMMGSLGKQDSNRPIQVINHDSIGRTKRKVVKQSPTNAHISLSGSLLEAAEYVLNEKDPSSNPLAAIPFIDTNIEHDIRKPKRNKTPDSISEHPSEVLDTNGDINDFGSNAQDSFPGGLAGSRRCQFEGCTKCAQGATKFCIGHGGGRRCTFPGCMKGARDKFFCAGHGGGKRCSVSDCRKSAVGGSDMCTLHGGGKRCSYPGCSKSSQSSTKYCVKHGGGRKCSISGCSKVSRGRTDFCAAHGGGNRCVFEDCQKAAIGKYQLCRHHQSTMSDAEAQNYLNDDDMDDQSTYSFPTSTS